MRVAGRRGQLHRVHLPPAGRPHFRPVDSAPGQALNLTLVPAGRSELFAPTATTRCSPTPAPMLAAERTHRGHAIIKQVIADLKGGSRAHLPSGRLATTSACWSWPRSRSTSRRRQHRTRPDRQRDGLRTQPRLARSPDRTRRPGEVHPLLPIPCQRRAPDEPFTSERPPAGPDRSRSPTVDTQADTGSRFSPINFDRRASRRRSAQSRRKVAAQQPSARPGLRARTVIRADTRPRSCSVASSRSATASACWNRT